jgi:disulfide bond formation protein DsbB
MLLITGVIPEKLEPCMQGVPCSERVIVWFGFVTIPLLSVTAFSAIIALLVLTRIRGSK